MDLEQLKKSALRVRIARDHALTFARNFRDQAEIRERRAAEMTQQLTEMEDHIARIEAQSEAA